MNKDPIPGGGRGAMGLVVGAVLVLGVCMVSLALSGWLVFAWCWVLLARLAVYLAMMPDQVLVLLLNFAFHTFHT